jgi:hypothetical protein
MLLMKPSQIGAMWGWGPLGRERGKKGPGGACGWVATRAPEIAHENLPHFIARNNTNEKRGGGGWKCRVNISVNTVLWMNFRRTGQFLKFQKTRIKELASSRHFKKNKIRIQELASSRYSNPSKNW